MHKNIMTEGSPWKHIIKFALLFLAIATGFSAGNGIVIAQCYGAGDEKGGRANASTGILLLMGLGVLSSLFAFLSARMVNLVLV